jgi:hypothetical protein
VTQIEDYLAIPPGYGSRLEGLHWSPEREAVLYEDGRTFALSGEIAAFLDGLASRRFLMHFAHVLHFLYLLRQGRTPDGDRDLGALSRAWQKAGRPVRTAGVLCGLLCRDVPNVPNAPRLQALTDWLRDLGRGWSIPVSSRQAHDDPPLSPSAFESLLARALEDVEDGELIARFHFGERPLDEEGRRLARELLAAKPPSLAARLEELSRDERLAGARPFVAQLLGASCCTTAGRSRRPGRGRRW